MKTLKIEIKGVNTSETAIILNALDAAKSTCANTNSIDISYSYKEEDAETMPIQVTESTPFTRYLQSTTPEGVTARPYRSGNGETISN